MGINTGRKTLKKGWFEKNFLVIEMLVPKFIYIVWHAIVYSFMTGFN